MGNPPAQNALLSPVMDSFHALERCIFRFCPLWNWSYHIGNGIPHLSKFSEDNSTFSLLPRPIYICNSKPKKGIGLMEIFFALRVSINDKFRTARLTMLSIRKLPRVVLVWSGYLLEKILLAWKDQPTSAPLLAQPCEVDQHMRNALSGKYFPGNRFFGLSFLRTFWEILANLVRWSWLFFFCKSAQELF